MPNAASDGLSRRERQILDVLFRWGPAHAAKICERLNDPPSDTAMRTLLRILEEKGHVRHRRVGKMNVYSPTLSKSSAQRGAVRHLVTTFFGGGVRDAVAALLDTTERRLTSEERRELIAMLRESDKKD